MSGIRRRDTRELIAVAAELGWTMVGITSKGHLRFQHPKGAVTTGPSRIEGRALENWRSEMRRLTRQLQEKQ
jgi:predicted RNA binding protein YcfA (HicA-like mRNA interferase family)